MGLKLTDSSGEEIELPVEKIEDIAAMKAENDNLKKEAGDAANKDWREARAKMKESDDKIAKVKEQAEKAGFELMADGTLKKKDVVPPAGGEKTPKEIAQEEIAAQRATDVEDARKDLVAKLANGDANKANVIEEKYNLVKGSKVITTLKEMQALMVDARKLAFSAKEDEGNGFNNLGGGGEMGAGADRTKTAGKERGKEIATAFGYQPKTKGGFDKL